MNGRGYWRGQSATVVVSQKCMCVWVDLGVLAAFQENNAHIIRIIIIIIAVCTLFVFLQFSPLQHKAPHPPYKVILRRAYYYDSQTATICDDHGIKTESGE